MLPEKDIEAVEAILNHRFGDRDLLITALTHPSMENLPNYQRLEFLGDRILGLLIAEWLYDTYPSEREGVLSKKLTALVRKETLSDVCLETGLSGYIIMDKSASSVGGKNNPAILSDVVEAVLAAMYLDGAMAPAKDFIRTHWSKRIDQVAKKDAKTALQEYVQGRGYQPPIYETVDRTGPDHAPSFVIEARVEGLNSATGKGSAKKEAQTNAAAALLKKLQNEI